MARVVGANEEELIHEYDALHGAPTAIRAADVFEPATPIRIKERRSPNWTLAMAVVLLLILGYGVYRVVGAATSGPHVARRGRRNLPPPAVGEVRSRSLGLANTAGPEQCRDPPHCYRGLLGRV